MRYMNKFLPFKNRTMKKLLLVLPVIAILMFACNSRPKTNPEDVARKVADSLRLAADTAGLAQFQAWKAQNEIIDQNMNGQTALAAAPAASRTSSSARRTNSASRSRSSGGGGYSSTSSNTAKAKKGWSKAAKGAVIGGVAGGAAGAIINKRNRVVGGIVGGVLGAGVGYGIGRGMDKKDGRY
jgi:hypothetical protein